MRSFRHLKHFAPAPPMGMHQGPGLPLETCVEFAIEARRRDGLLLPVLLDPGLRTLVCFGTHGCYSGAPTFDTRRDIRMCGQLGAAHGEEVRRRTLRVR